jgi:hypothetical protein
MAIAYYIEDTNARSTISMFIEMGCCGEERIKTFHLISKMKIKNKESGQILFLAREIKRKLYLCIEFQWCTSSTWLC